VLLPIWFAYQRASLQLTCGILMLLHCTLQGDDVVDTADRVSQRLLIVPVQDQCKVLFAELQQMQAAGEKVIVFFPTARQTGLAALQFNALGMKVQEIHSRLSQGK